MFESSVATLLSKTMQGLRGESGFPLGNLGKPTQLVPRSEEVCSQ